MPEIISCSSGDLSNILKTYEGASLVNQYLLLTNNNISSFSVTFAEDADLSNMDVYLDSELLSSTDYTLENNVVTLTFNPGDHKILFVFNETDKESSVFYIKIEEVILYNFTLNYDESEGAVAGKVDGSDYTFTIGEAGNALPLGVTIELTATASEGFAFVGWANAENKIISYDSTYIFKLLEDTTITPLFYQENENEVARIGATGYETLEAALTEAVSGDIVILLKDYALTQSITVPEDYCFYYRAVKKILLDTLVTDLTRMVYRLEEDSPFCTGL